MEQREKEILNTRSRVFVWFCLDACCVFDFAHRFSQYSSSIVVVISAFSWMLRLPARPFARLALPAPISFSSPFYIRSILINFKFNDSSWWHSNFIVIIAKPQWIQQCTYRLWWKRKIWILTNTIIPQIQEITDTPVCYAVALKCTRKKWARARARTLRVCGEIKLAKGIEIETK